MKALAVIDKNLGLGYANDLLFHLPTDLAHFKKHTLGQSVVMGDRTLASMPKGQALPGRNTLVLDISRPSGKLYDVAKSKDQQGADYSGPESYICYSFENLDEFRAYIIENKDKLGDIVVSGGATIYRLLLDDCDELVITEVEAAAEKVDVYFPEFRDNFDVVKSEGPYYDGSLEYNIRYYKKKEK